jgi:hypothetical protein
VIDPATSLSVRPWSPNEEVSSPVTYRLYKLAPGSYDIILNGVIIDGLVRSTTGRQDVTWVAELLIELPDDEQPSPFTQTEHAFSTLDAACRWVGVSETRMRETSLKVISFAEPPFVASNFVPQETLRCCVSRHLPSLGDGALLPRHQTQ